MAQHPVEIYGHYFKAKNATAKKDWERHWCPFVDKVCYKKSRLVDVPFGVCTARAGHSDIAICPRRFLERNQVFQDIAMQYFGSTSDLLLFSEVGLPSVGNFDFVMVQHKPMSSEIKDFIVIEFQTGQTTSTGALVQGFRDFIKEGSTIEGRRYNFGINHYDIWKRTFTQVLNKGIILEKWGHKVYWVIQEPIFNYFQKRYNLTDITYDANHATRFAIYDLPVNGDEFQLTATRLVSSTVDQMFKAFRNNPNIPPVGEFKNRLREKLMAHVNLKMEFDLATQPVDIHPPKE